MPIEKFLAPASLDGVLDVLSEYGSDALVLAGGTMVMPLINEALTAPRVVVSLQGTGLSGVRMNGQVEMGAMTTLTRVSQVSELPLLASAARDVGSWAIRNMATLGGNLFAPPPSGDAAVALLALDAQVVIQDKRGSRQVALDEFYTGLFQTTLRPEELVTRIVVPKPIGDVAWLKYARREANAPAVVAVAARLVRDAAGVIAEARLALGAVSEFPIRAKAAESVLVGNSLNSETIAAAADAAMAESRPFSDALASAWYRKRMVGVNMRRALEALMNAPHT